MKNGILIDPFTNTITEVKFSNLQSIYNLLDVQLIQVGEYLENGDVIYVDEEGLLNNQGNTRGFRFIGGANSALVGKGLIVGTSDEGETISCKTLLEEAEDKLLMLGLTVQF